MVETISELRKKVQEPVRAYNDVAGLLVGDRISIHVTRLFLALGLSPTVGTIGMLVTGLTGSVMLLFGEGWSVVGFALMFAYYVLDCVDGEVARYRQREKLVWGFHDCMFHLYVKSAFFTCLGIYAAQATGRWWVFLFGLSALLATLLTKSLYEAVLVLAARYVLMRSSADRERFVREITAGASIGELDQDGDLPGDCQPFTLGRNRGLVRATLTNFDLAVLWFLSAAVIDLFLVPFTVWGLPWDLKCALLAFYGLVLPLDFLDRLVTYMRQDGFHRDARRLLRRAHHFRLH